MNDESITVNHSHQSASPVVVVVVVMRVLGGLTTVVHAP